MKLGHSGYDKSELSERLRQARSRLDELAATLPEDAWLGPYAPSLNPPLWEYGHIAWFQEQWCLRLKSGRSAVESPLLQPLAPSRLRWADWLYDSSRIPHQARWRAPLPAAPETLAYGKEVLDDVLARIAAESSDALSYYAELSLYHEQMHIEAWWMMWQQLGYAPPRRPELPCFDRFAALEISAASVTVGSAPDKAFVFDNEKWAHEVALAAFEIDARPVRCGEFAAFVAAGGYSRNELWCAEGRQWLVMSGARHPLYWRGAGEAWQVRRFDRWLDLPAEEPVIHVNRYEAHAYCTWRGRVLPSAAQWLKASATSGFALGRCWEWTRDAFLPYGGFAPDPYADYSVPWFGSHAEVRGAGSWVTDGALARPTYRNFYLPERRDPFIGFRTASAAAA
ncbi:MAG: ergothioneine biosynthesis protein EgtB [Burkholderiales bacterium]|nr:ergothioneine biosynthesis protein EgtB [Burkholderiales bacterium]